MPTVSETIRRLREQTGLTPRKVAELIGMNVSSYFDLEAYADEWENSVEFRQLLELSHVLDTPLLEFINEPVFVGDPLSFPELAELIGRSISDGQIIEDQTGWDYSAFVETPMVAMEYPIIFLKIVGEDAGVDWRSPVLFYQKSFGQHLPGKP